MPRDAVGAEKARPFSLMRAALDGARPQARAGRVGRHGADAQDLTPALAAQQADGQRALEPPRGVRLEPIIPADETTCARRPTKTGASRGQGPRDAEQGEVVLRGPCRSRCRGRPRRVGGPPARGGEQAFGEESRNLGDDVLVAQGWPAWSWGLRRPCASARRALRQPRPRMSLSAQGADVVDDRRARIERAPAPSTALSVSTETGLRPLPKRASTSTRTRTRLSSALTGSEPGGSTRRRGRGCPPLRPRPKARRDGVGPAARLADGRSPASR